MNSHELVASARLLVAGDQGLLAMDESSPTCNERFAKAGIAQSTEMRRAYGELLVTRPSLAECISGAIPYDETIREQKSDGAPFAKAVSDAGMIVGIKVDAGALRALFYRAQCDRAARRGEYDATLEMSVDQDPSERR